MSSENAEPSPTSVAEVEFRLTDPSYPFVSVALEEGCRVELTEILPRDEGRYAEFFRVDDAPADRVESAAADHDRVDARHLDGGDGGDGGDLYEFVVAENCPAVTLSEEGARPRVVRGTETGGRIVAEVPESRDAATVVEAFLAEHPGAELVAKRQKEAMTPPLGLEDAPETVRSRLTDRQFTVLQTAYESGYYDWPRECTGKEVASDLEIAPATFSQHIHVAERKLLESLFEDSDGA